MLATLRPDVKRFTVTHDEHTVAQCTVAPGLLAAPDRTQRSQQSTIVQKIAVFCIIIDLKTEHTQT